MLGGCRVLDLTDEKGFLCGKILADMGADVIKVEKPQGRDSGRTGPFWKDIADPEKSLYWLAYNTNKRGITLNYETSGGREILKKLALGADFLIEAFPPGWLDEKGLGYSSLREINPKIIVASITPFGQQGPYRDFKASDLIVMGMSGLLYLTGDVDRAPLNVSIPQSHMLAGADAAVGAMMAHYRRIRTGLGQHVDVSMQQSAAWFLANTVPYWELGEVNLRRAGVMRSMNARDAMQRQVWPCRDGYVFFFILGGISGAKTSRQLVKWMEDEGRGDDFLRNMEWEKFDMGAADQELLDRISKPIADFFSNLTKKEILDAAIERNISVCSLSSMEDLIEDRHLKERNFWTKIAQPGLGIELPYPRRFGAVQEPGASEAAKAPGIGEHNAAVYSEIGLGAGDLEALKQAGVI